MLAKNSKKPKKVTIDELAVMVQDGFVMMNKWFDRIEKRFDRIDRTVLKTN